MAARRAAPNEGRLGLYVCARALLEHTRRARRSCVRGDCATWSWATPTGRVWLRVGVGSAESSRCGSRFREGRSDQSAIVASSVMTTLGHDRPCGGRARS